MHGQNHIKFAVFIGTAKFENVGWKLLRNARNLLPTNMLLSVPLWELQALCYYRRHIITGVLISP